MDVFRFVSEWKYNSLWHWTTAQSQRLLYHCGMTEKGVCNTFHEIKGTGFTVLFFTAKYIKPLQGWKCKTMTPNPGEIRETGKWKKKGEREEKPKKGAGLRTRKASQTLHEIIRIKD